MKCDLSLKEMRMRAMKCVQEMKGNRNASLISALD